MLLITGLLYCLFSVADDLYGHLGPAHHTPLNAKPATHAVLLADDGGKNSMPGVLIAYAIVDGYGGIYEGADAVAHLTAVALHGDTELVIDDGKPHVNIFPAVHRLERLTGAGFYTGKIHTESASLCTHIKGWGTCSKTCGAI